jgi:NADH-quinone oxidoreductase subunit E
MMALTNNESLRDRESLIPLLQQMQGRDGYVSPEAVRELSRRVGISESEIFGVATFYDLFRFEPPADHTIRVCQGTACHVQGAAMLLHDFEERLKINAGSSSEDGRFGLERVACVGCCALAPVVVVDGEVRGHMKPKTVRTVLAHLEKEAKSRP